ncbi:hypothetical protein CICLE_v10026884mg [Citrus x clementina]|uniref:Uncharacterized protein n=1 Tax=Citrus clementina TaxID=85681 RepID=V4SQP1_CITCL|nr:hypothetical protein CICLE_v10026884mg [Citrus x clementina]
MLDPIERGQLEEDSLLPSGYSFFSLSLLQGLLQMSEVFGRTVTVIAPASTGSDYKSANALSLERTTQIGVIYA